MNARRPPPMPQQQPMMQGRPNMMGPPPGPPSSAGGVESREIPIPADLIGGMIGPGGSTINDLRKQAGQQIARISGNHAAVNGAEALVRAKLLELSEAKSRNNPGGPGPPMQQQPM